MMKAEKLRIAAEYLDEAIGDDALGSVQQLACRDIADWLRIEADRLDRESAIRAVARQDRLSVKAIRKAIRSSRPSPTT